MEKVSSKQTVASDTDKDSIYMGMFKNNQSKESTKTMSKGKKILNLIMALGVPGIIVSFALWIIDNRPDPYAKETAKVVEETLEKYNSIIERYALMDMTDTAKIIYKSQKELHSSLVFFESYTKGIEEMSRRKKLKSLTTENLRVLANDRIGQRAYAMGVVTKSINIIAPFVDPPYSDKAVYIAVNTPQFYSFVMQMESKFNRVISLQKAVGDELDNVSSRLSHYQSSPHKIDPDKKPKKELYSLLSDIVVCKGELIYINALCDALSDFEEYMFKLIEYYNNPNK